MSAIVIAFFKFGFLDELDFWAGTFGLVVFAAIEIVLFSWVFGLKKGWQEMHKGADLKVPRIFKFILTYVTPIYLLVLLGVLDLPGRRQGIPDEGQGRRPTGPTSGAPGS